MNWTEQEDKILVALSTYEATSFEISTVLSRLGFDRSPNAVRNRANRISDSITHDPTQQTFREYMRATLSEKEIDIVLSVIEDDEEEDQGTASTHLSPLRTPGQKATESKKARNIYNEMAKSLTQLASETQDKRKIIPAPVASQKESAVFVLSDTHVGRKVISNSGEVLYNTPTASRQIDRFVQRGIQEVRRRARNNIDEAILVLVGDLPDNELIFDTQPFHLDTFVLEQVNATTRAIWNACRSLVEEFKSLRVVTVRGNHGRLGGSESGNLDNIVYCNIDLLAQETGLQVDVSITGQIYNTFTVKGHKGLIRHKIPKQDGTSSPRDKFGGWHVIHKYSFMIGAHWHQFKVGNYHDMPIFYNGAICPPDDLAEDMAASGESDNRPTQLVFGVSEKAAPTFISPIRLD